MSCPKPMNPIAYLKCPYSISLLIILVSVASLSSAYIAQYVFGLQPCILCLYQRVPFFITLVIGILSLIFSIKKKYKISIGLIAFSGVAYLVNSGIAFFHSGVERKWWKGFEGCSAPDLTGMTPSEMAAAIRNMPAVLCDKIPWEMFGLSMANYNVALCLGMGIVCIASAIIIYNRKKNEL